MDADTRAWLQEPIDERLAIGVGIAWLVLVPLAMALEPHTTQPEPWFGVVLQVVGTALIASTAVGLVVQRRFGFVASLAAAAFVTAASIACPVSGHHSFGAWWFAQMACSLALVAVSVIALQWSANGLPLALRNLGKRNVTADDGASRD